MNAPYGLETGENCLSCKLRKNCAFCSFSPEVLKHFNNIGHISALPGGALLFIEGQKHGEAGLHTAQALSKEFQAVYQDIHDLVMARSSAGKLAKLLLSWIPIRENGKEVRISSGLTHEEMAQMIGSSRETVTRLLSDLKKKQFIRLEGSMLVIRNRTALEALAS